MQLIFAVVQRALLTRQYKSGEMDRVADSVGREVLIRGDFLAPLEL